MPHRKFLAELVGKIKPEGIRINPKAFIHIADHIAFCGIKKNRNIADRQAAAIKITEYMTSREYYVVSCHKNICQRSGAGAEMKEAMPARFVAGIASVF